MGRVVRFEEWVGRGHLRHQLWWALLVEQPPLLFLVFFLEVYTVIAIIDTSFRSFSSSDWTLVIGLLFLVVWLQFNEGWSNRTHPKHIANMAVRAGRKIGGQSKDFSLNVYWLRHCLAGMARLGNFRSGGHFEDILIVHLQSKSEKLSEPVTESPTQQKILKGIEMQMAVAEAFPGDEEKAVSCVKFCTEVKLYGKDDGPAVGEVADLLVKQYRGLSEGVKRRLESKEEKVSLDRIYSRALRREIVAVSVGTILSGLLGIFLRLTLG